MTSRKAFEKFLEQEIQEANDYSRGVTPDEEDIARNAWQAAVEWALEEAAKKCEEVGNRAENYETSDAADSIRIMKELK